MKARKSDRNMLSRSFTAPVSVVAGAGEFVAPPPAVTSFRSISARTSRPVCRTSGKFSPLSARS